jgi:hypothetical protein
MSCRKLRKHLLHDWTLDEFANRMIRFEICILELSRVWEWYIGRPVSARKWHFTKVNHDEL